MSTIKYILFWLKFEPWKINTNAVMHYIKINGLGGKDVFLTIKFAQHNIHINSYLIRKPNSTIKKCIKIEVMLSLIYVCIYDPTKFQMKI